MSFEKVILVICLFFSSLALLIAILPEKDYENKIIKIELDDRNFIYNSGKIKGLICDNNVYVDGQYYVYKFFPFGNDYAYLSTWRDGNIPHSKGVCYLKVRERKA